MLFRKIWCVVREIFEKVRRVSIMFRKIRSFDLSGLGSFHNSNRDFRQNYMSEHCTHAANPYEVKFHV